MENEDLRPRLHALEGDYRRVEARLSGVESTLTVMASEAARSGQAILSKVETVASEVTAIKAAQTTETGRRLGVAQVMRVVWIVAGFVFLPLLGFAIWAFDHRVRDNIPPPGVTRQSTTSEVERIAP